MFILLFFCAIISIGQVNMNSGNILTIASLFYIFLLMVVYFSKKRIKTIENKIYSMLLISNFIGLIVAILCYFTVLNYETLGITNYIVSRLYLVYLVTFIFLFFLYLVVIINPKDKEMVYHKAFKVFSLIELSIILLIYYLPLEFNNVNGVYSYGASANVVYVLATVCMIIWTVLILLNRKKVLLKKLVPITIFILGAMLTTIIQKINPALLLMTGMESFVIFLMYFTIENPDVSMLNELYKNKELMEQNYEDKYNFLFEMTQEARNPLININSVFNELREVNDNKKIKEGLQKIYNLTRQLDFSINNILNISSLDVQKIKIINSKYDLEKICKDLETKIKPEVPENVEFHLSLPKSIPVLFGDYMKLKQIIYSLLLNSCKNTAIGSINLKVNLIEKYDVARVIFNISDTGCGIGVEKINEIMSSTGEFEKEEIDNLEKREYNLSVCQKVMKIMGGSLMIKSNIGEGTEIVLTIDQRVYHEKDNSLLTQYENQISNFRKALIVAQDKEVISLLRKKLNSLNVTASTLYYGMDAVDKIKSGKKYDFILIEDAMKEITGFMTFKKMREIKGFDIPTIIMLNEDKEHIKEHFIDDGFTDYLLVDKIDSEVERLMEKY